MFKDPSKAAPRPLSRPAFARWVWERDLTLKEVGEALGCSYEQVRLICLPFSDPKRRVPDEPLIRRIHEYTGGEIGVAQWYPAELQSPIGERADLRVLAAGRAS
jgi:hypothetical protein